MGVINFTNNFIKVTTVIAIKVFCGFLAVNMFSLAISGKPLITIDISSKETEKEN